FWHSVSLRSGRYKGNPMVAHMRQKAITPAHFDRWLALWTEATSEIMSPPVAALLQTKAARIGESLKLALFFQLPPTPRDASQQQ
ncbi:MAG TPA: group III truncated hemoglobin, partial [Candidatus Binatia bacterium]|nr:group III truncated hemoglobin [Candidatus Binatia bacterium]